MDDIPSNSGENHPHQILRNRHQTKCRMTSWGERSLSSLWLYYEYHREAFEELRKNLSMDDFLYTPMKLMDMCLWQIGFDEENTTNI